MLKVWDAETGACIATLPLLGMAKAVACHPYRASAAIGQTGGPVYHDDLLGVTTGPPVVTAVNPEDGPRIRCPVCFEQHPLQQAWLGREIDCPDEACDARLKVNPFVVRRE
jgi:hypothetical protein